MLAEMYSMVVASGVISTGRFVSEMQEAYCYGNLFLNLQKGHIQNFD